MTELINHHEITAQQCLVLNRPATEQERLDFGEMAKAIGAGGWRRGLATTNSQLALNPPLEQGELADVKKSRWNDALDRMLQKARTSLRELETAGRRVGRKISLAVILRETGVPCSWIAEKLGPGSANALWVGVYRYRKHHNR